MWDAARARRLGRRVRDGVERSRGWPRPTTTGVKYDPGDGVSSGERRSDEVPRDDARRRTRHARVTATAVP
jgi:hypothetical protein